MNGRCFGASGTKVAEVVFNTSLSGYQEIMTDPSYRDQMVCFTHPHIGNVGINDGMMNLMLATNMFGLCIDAP
jgi:carbamoyl-phosphate synthase small subunit